MAMENLTIIRGDDINITLAFTDTDGDPVDLTGSTLFFTVKEKLSDVDDDAVIEKDVTSHTNPTGGVTVLALTSTDTDINAGSYYWDIQIKNEAGKIASSQKGLLKVLQDVTLRTN